MEKDIEFPEWRGYEDLEKMKQLIGLRCYNDPKQILEYAAKMTLERTYFKDELLFLQDRIQRHIEEIFEGLMLVPVEDVTFPEDHEDEKGEKGNDEDIYEQFVKDMERAGIEYDGEYNGRFFYHGPAVMTNEKGFPTLQDVIRATKVRLQWDNLGKLDYIVYPGK